MLKLKKNQFQKNIQKLMKKKNKTFQRNKDQ